MKRLNSIDVFSMRVFVSMYENENASSVAKELDVAPSKISRCLSTLRHVLDNQLFIRRHHGFEATSMADRLYPCFEQLLQAVQQIDSLSHPTALQPPSEIIIHAPATLRGCLFTKLQQVLATQGHQFSLSIKPISLHNADKLLDNGSDLVLTFGPCEGDRFSNHFIADGEQLFLIAREDHALFQLAEGEMLEASLNYPFVIVDCPGFNDKVDPLELYAIGQHHPLTIAGTMGGLSETANHLRQTDDFTFVASSCAASFFIDFPGVNARRFSPTEFEQLHRRTGVPNYYAIESKDKPVPPPVLEAIETLITECVTLPSGC